LASGALAALVDAASGTANLIEPLVDCARARCTEGEIVQALSGVFGDYSETPRF
jgi:methylmalonyl-CoA mutase N-terminal domain/subunit